MFAKAKTMAVFFIIALAIPVGLVIYDVVAPLLTPAV